MNGDTTAPMPDPDATLRPTKQTISLGGAPNTPPSLSAGTVFGNYTIEGVLGAGGMGVVYRARQDRPAREVALKVIRAGFASKQALRRFELEADVLGRLQHPGIAQVYEAGTAHGQPFFAMEFIRGVSLTDYAQANHLGTRDLLGLLARICDAVDHAHQKGVIHRDLKPGNILIDESGLPKILDFGVARATDSDIQQTTIQTDIGQLIGTVPYMSPEQVSGDPAELDTRSDVYALGVISYELLAGRLPYDLHQKMIHEAVRIIRETEPTRLSVANKTLRGDVETIVAKALEKEKERRYQSAAALAADIRRYLKDEPIAARPASTVYQLRKFARRNKILVGGVVAAFLLLLAGVIGTSLALCRALHAEAETTRRADELQQVSDFQAQMLSQVDPTVAGKLLTTDVQARFGAALAKSGIPEPEMAKQSVAFADHWTRVNATDAALALIDAAILKPAVQAIETQFADQPLVDAQLRQVVADRYHGLGLYDAALPLQESALATRRRVLGDEHQDTLTSLNSMGRLLRSQGKLDEAERCFREGLGTRRRVLGADHPDTLTSIADMGNLLKAQGKFAEAEQHSREALEKRRRVLGEDHPDTLASLNNMASVLEAQGKHAEAEPYIREALQKSRRLLGEDHPTTLASLNNMGGVLEAQGKHAEAERYYREAVEGFRRVLGEEHPDTLTSMNNMGFLLQARGKPSEAEPYWREVMDKRRRVLGNEHKSTLVSVNNMGFLLKSQGKLAEAEQYYREALEGFRRVMGEEHPTTLTSISNMGTLLQAQGKFAEAEPYSREALEKRRRLLGEEHPDTLVSIATMGSLLRAQSKYDEAIDLLEPGELVARKIFTGENASRLATLLTTLGCARVGLGYDAERFALAETNLREAHTIFVEARGETHKDTLGCVQGLIDLYASWSTAEPTKGYDTKVAEWQAKLDAINAEAAKGAEPGGTPN